MLNQPLLVRMIALPFATSAVATLVTWQLWPYIAPSASPLFFVAVMISSLYGGIAAGQIATVLAGLATAYFFMTPQFSLAIDPSNIFRLVVFAAVALLTNWIAAKRNRADAAQRQLVEQLQTANARIRTLSDMLPICPDCRRVRVGEGNANWKSVETYLAETPELQLSHALCPDCSARHFPEFHTHAS